MVTIVVTGPLVGVKLEIAGYRGGGGGVEAAVAVVAVGGGEPPSP